MRRSDRLLDNHEVISEHSKSCYWKTSAQSSQRMGFGKIMPQSRLAEKYFVNLELMIERHTLLD